VLLVDDCQQFVRAFVRKFSKETAAGLRIESASSLEEALEKLCGNPRLVLLDVNLGPSDEDDGVAFLARLRNAGYRGAIYAHLRDGL
jgi:DNA-binding response OmpR family regulator